jgi:Cof subfamily protein (haloacid dehalogenase superfamily)
MTELLRQIRIVLMDIDGTLIRGSDDTIDHVVTQLRKLKPLGIRFSVATGRTLFGAQRIIRDMSAVGMRMPPVIAYNGAVVAWPEDTAVLHRFTLPQGPVRLLLAGFRRRLITPFVYTCQNRFDASTVERVYGDERSATRPATEFNGMPISWVESFDEVPLQDVVAILGQQSDPSQDIRPTVEELGQAFGDDMRITSSGNLYVEVAHPQSTKANALHVLSRQWGVLPSQIMAIGDNYNDLEMLEVCGVGVAVANAPPPVQQVAQYVCKREAAQGVVEALRLLLGAVRHGQIESRVREEHHDAY